MTNVGITNSSSPARRAAVQTATGDGETKDLVSINLNLKPEQIPYKALQAFIRQMAVEGTPVSMNFGGQSEGLDQAVSQAEGFAQQAAVSANRAKQEADRAQQIANGLQPVSSPKPWVDHGGTLSD